MSKVLFPIQKNGGRNKQYDIVKYPDGSVARQLENVSRQTSHVDYRRPNVVAEPVVRRDDRVMRQEPVANRVASKALPVRKFEDDILFSRLQGISGNNNENLSEEELQKIKADIERTSQIELQKRRDFLLGRDRIVDDSWDKSYGSEFI